MDSGLGRKAGLVLLMVAGLSLLIWAGVHNNRDRKLAQQQQTPTVVLKPKSSGRTGEAAPEEMTPKLEGKTAPAFSLVSLDGKKVALADLKGHPVFLNFWATWCEPCKLEMPWLEEFSHKYAAKGLIILGISTDDAGKSVVASTVKKLGVTYPILLKNDKIEDDYDIQFAPESFYLDKAGKVVLAVPGVPAGGKDEIEANINKLLVASGQ